MRIAGGVRFASFPDKKGFLDVNNSKASLALGLLTLLVACSKPSASRSATPLSFADAPTIHAVFSSPPLWTSLRRQAWSFAAPARPPRRSRFPLLRP